jgi:predicted dehydrogenase
MRPVGVGVIGCGYWGPNLVRNFHRYEGSRVTALADIVPSRASMLGAEYGTPVVTGDAAELIQNADVDLVVVATPVWTHYRLAKAALTAGKHVLVMKPLTSKPEHAEELCDLASANGLLLAVDHTFVFTGAVRKMKDLVDQGELGELFYFDSVRINLGLFQSDVNVLWDLAPHDISILDYVLGQEPDEVAAVGMSHSGSVTENIAYLTLRYGDTFLAHIHVNWLAPAKIRRTILGGSRKMLIYDDMEPSEKIRIYDKGVTIESEPVGDTNSEYKMMVSYRSGDMLAPQLETREALATEVENIVDSLSGHATLISDGYAGLRVVRILTAAAESMHDSGAPLVLPGARVAAAR